MLQIPDVQYRWGGAGWEGLEICLNLNLLTTATGVNKASSGVQTADSLLY